VHVSVLLLHLADIESNPFNIFEILVLSPVLTGLFFTHLTAQTFDFFGLQSVDLIYLCLFTAFVLISCLWGLVALLINRIIELSRVKYQG